MIKQDIVNYFRNSCFRQMQSGAYSTNITRFNWELLIRLDYEEYERVGRQPIEDFDIQKYIPPFQRTNDKWTRDMQIKFIENILKGVTSTIILCEVEGNENAIILDGQQRLTALKAFLCNEFPILGKFYYKDIKEEIKMVSANIYYRVIVAKDKAEMIQFYIDMNENITHSKEDIDKAKRYLEAIKRGGF